jgi:two-component system phosphate regulon sensor histidine kinase PhoR
MILHSLRVVWMDALTRLGGVALVAIAVGARAGAAAGWALLAAVLLAVGVWNLHQLLRLVSWTRAPLGTPLPVAGGLWGRVFAEVAHRAHQSYETRDQLVAALARFHEAGQAMPDGVMYLSRSGNIEWLNRKAEQHFGLDRSRDLGAPLTHLVRNPEFVRYLHSQQYAEPLLMHSGRSGGLTLQVQIVPFGEERFQVLSRDVSQLEKLETVRRDFVANVSHELRTPLTVIDGFLEILSDGIDDFSPEDVHRFLSLAHEQSDRMRRLIDDLLNLSALETGAPAPAEDCVDAAELVRVIVRETELLSAGRHHVSVVVEGPGLLHGSHKELHSALANLATNAVRYTPEGGHIEIGWRCGGQGAEFWVQDDGIGIEAEHIPRLTERFYRVDRGRSRETGGTGLGLAIVKHILTRHQAELRISSTPGAGSRFVVSFPPTRVTAR